MISNNINRERAYAQFLATSKSNSVTVTDIIKLGVTLMRKARLHPHFFANNTLLATAQYLVFFSLDLPYEYSNSLYLQRPLNEAEILKILRVFEKRIGDRVPVEYITNEADYLGFKFYVNENVIVPRSLMNTRFTEFLAAVEWQNFRVLDLCTGSGCVGITLALLHRLLKVDLVDISPEALTVAARNISKYSLQDRVSCIQSDLFENVQEKYDLIITNPPYVSAAEYKRIPAEFKNEPKISLEAADQGLEIINRILQQSKDYLMPHGKLIVEVGYPAAKRLKSRYRHLPLEWYSYKKPNSPTTFFTKWIEPLVAMPGVLACDAKFL